MMRLWLRFTHHAITQANSRSALPVDFVSRISTTNPFRFSINTCAMKLSFDSLPRDSSGGLPLPSLRGKLLCPAQAPINGPSNVK